MKIFSIELKISLLILVIVVAVLATGYLSYKNLSEIVYSIRKEARPDYKLIKIKEITSDLTEADNSVRLYSLTREPKYLKPYDKVINTIDKHVEELLNLQDGDTSQIANLKSMEELIGERLVVWDKILQLHSKPIEKEVFSDFYSSIEQKTADTVVKKKDNILKRFFKKKKEEIPPPSHSIAKTEVHQKVEELEKSLNDKAQQLAGIETQLLRRNNELGAQMQFLILQMEQKETESLFLRSMEAEQLARQTYKGLLIFCISAVVMLLMVLLVIINYSRKSSQTQQYLRKAKNEADTLVKAKELFTATVSHELRTPMNAIYGLAEQLLQQVLDPKLREQLTVIKRSSEHLNKVVSDILDFSKMEAGKLEIETIPFNPLRLFEDIYTLHKVIADQKHLCFKCTFDDNLPVQLLGDPTRLNQIILNLLNNAFKFTGRGEVSMDIHPAFPKPKSVLLTIKISDTGIGITPEKLPAIFDDYSQADQSTTRRYGGTGLGLSIVKKLVELMNGSISVQSVMHEGTTFTCTIPFELSEAIALPVETTRDIITVPEKIQNLSILIADDEEYNRMLLTTIFNKWKAKFRMVTNGKDAIVLAKDSFYHLILMDIRMPEMNGFEASEQILDFSPESKIVLLTAGITFEDMEKSKNIGISGVILKPFSEKELLTRIIDALGDDGIEIGKQYNLSTDIALENTEKFGQPTFDTETITSINYSEALNFEELSRLSGDDGHFMEEMLRLFIKATSEGVNNLDETYKAQNWKGLSDAAHKMAPPCKHLGVMDLYNNLKILEKTDFVSLPSEKLAAILDTIKKQVSAITFRIEQKIGSMQTS